ncbi:hypothetical protein ACI796_03705 [Geodermatophilus sp. SYSU D00525]
MSAAVPAAELASAFGERDVRRWREHMGRLVDPLAPADLYALEHDERGPYLADRTLWVLVCIYVAVDDAGACLYIGQCRRSYGGVVARVDGHHTIPPFATGLWVLPLRADCPEAALDRIEARMIRTYRPPYNTVYCPPQFRASEAL